ncbi:MAG: hypothetical protein QXQ02_06320 [Halobacteria archaeon]
MGIVLFRNDSGISIKELNNLSAEIEKNLELKPSIVEIPLNTYFDSGILGVRIFDEFQRFIAQLGMGETKRIVGVLLVSEPVPIDFVEFTDDKRIILAAAKRGEGLVTAVKILHLLGHALTLRKDYDYYLEHGFAHCQVKNCIMNPEIGHADAISPEGMFICSDSLREIKEGIKFLGLDKELLEIKPAVQVEPEVIEFEKAGKPKFSLRKLLTRTKYRLKHLRVLPVKKKSRPPLKQMKQEEISPPAASAGTGGISMQAGELLDKTGLSGDALFPVDWNKAYSTKYIADMLDYYVQQSKRRQKKE